MRQIALLVGIVLATSGCVQAEAPASRGDQTYEAAVAASGLREAIAVGSPASAARGPGESYAAWRARRISSLSIMTDSDPRLVAGIQELAEAAVEERRPKPRAGVARERAIAAEADTVTRLIGANISERAVTEREAARQEAEASARRHASDRLALAACNARAQVADAMYPDRSILRLGAMISSIQVRNACLDYYRVTGQVPGF